ncbi:hypothetical protein NDU88_001963 [Pleurodeles waltl]|uniref:Uncharacterized protein n=1 Tax=Pleurodeles waltl TaxID=8319 RepID=A0AAV7P700_PLEWA|nr:hypothetical protein NDU88_001963 [Pleurodeles waltl]
MRGTWQAEKEVNGTADTSGVRLASGKPIEERQTEDLYPAGAVSGRRALADHRGGSGNHTKKDLQEASGNEIGELFLPADTSGIRLASGKPIEERQTEDLYPSGAVSGRRALADHRGGSGDHRKKDLQEASGIKLRVMAENKSHLFATPEAAWEWLESTGRASGGVAERAVPVPRGKRNRARRIRKRGEIRAGPVARAPDLEQLMQERREAIHSAAAISASPLASESDTELSQPPSDQPITPDCLSD